jgi:transposase
MTKKEQRMDKCLPKAVGVDISKATPDAFAHPVGCERQFANTAAGHKDLIGWLAPFQVDRIAYDATGAYHRQLEQALAHLPCVKLNPARARRFAKVAGTLAKTDKIDGWCSLASGNSLLLEAHSGLPWNCEKPWRSRN